MYKQGLALICHKTKPNQILYNVYMYKEDLAYHFRLFNNLQWLICHKIQPSLCEDIPPGVVANVLDCDIAVSEFDLQSRYWAQFRTNSLVIDITSLSIKL